MLDVMLYKTQCISHDADKLSITMLDNNVLSSLLYKMNVTPNSPLVDPFLNQLSDYNYDSWFLEMTQNQCCCVASFVKTYSPFPTVTESWIH